MGPRDLPGALRTPRPTRAGLRIALVLATLVAGPWAQGAGEQQRIAVRSERTARFFELWGEADDDRRAAAERLLAELEDPGAPLGSRPSVEAITLATAALAGADPAELLADGLQRFLLALDLEVAPGAFPAAAKGRGEPTTVQVRLAYDSKWTGEVPLSLVWIGPAGEEIRARTEPFSAASFRGPGFPMFLRAPLSGPGLWHLVPLVEADGRRVAGVAVGVECVEGVEAAAGRAGFLRPLAFAPEGTARAGGLLGGFPSDRRGLALVLSAPLGPGFESALAGPVGEAWIDLARRRGIGLFVLSARPDDDAFLLAALAELERRHPAARLVLVARGRAISFLQLALLRDRAAGSGPPFAGLVLSATDPRLALPMPEVPTLVVSPDPVPEPHRRGVVHRRGASTVFLTEPLLPSLVGAWLDGRPFEEDR